MFNEDLIKVFYLVLRYLLTRKIQERQNLKLLEVGNDGIYDKDNNKITILKKH